MNARINCVTKDALFIKYNTSYRKRKFELQIGWKPGKSGLPRRLAIGVCYNKNGSDFDNRAET